MKRTLIIAAMAALLLSAAPITGYADTEKSNMEGEVTPPVISEVNQTTIRVVNATNMRLEIYNLTGVQVASFRIDSADKTINHNLQRGCYLLKVGKVVRKVTIR